MKYVQWHEPYDGNSPSLNVISRMTVDDAIAGWKRTHAPNLYDSDQEALEDFIVCHWAQIVEYPDET